MKRLTFKCVFKTDVVLNATTATEENQTSLDYIPGANFLGIVAKKYGHFADKGVAYDIFHSGKVRFGDAHVVVDGIRSFKAPLVWFRPKGEKSDKTITVEFTLSEAQRQHNRGIGVQLKQEREGFFVIKDNELRCVEIAKSFALKSAQDRETRRSAKGQIFGYESIASGTEWIFFLDLDSEMEVYLDELVEALVGYHRLGRSRSAEFGLVLIEQIESIPTKNGDYGGLLIYADSNLCFFDESGSPTYRPTAKQLGFDQMEINWEKSQIRTYIYAPWNQKRYNRDADRYCISKGSVFVLEGNVPDSFSEHFTVGDYTSEGFGQVVINPEFLKFDPLTGVLRYRMGDKINSAFTTNTLNIKESEIDRNLLQYLKRKRDDYYEASGILNEVADFKREKENRRIYREISNSQWGNIRSIATRSATHDELIKLLFEKGTGYLTHGIASDNWKDDKIDKLKEKLEEVDSKKYSSCEFTILLAAEMAKQNTKR